MNIIKIVMLLLGALYGGLSLLAGAGQLKQRKLKLWSSLLMISGGGLLIAAVVMNILAFGNSLYTLILGLIFIHISAVANGISLYGRLHVTHHAVRLSISISLVILCLL